LGKGLSLCRSSKFCKDFHSPIAIAP
jgi:hypothetical protein